MIHRQKIGAFRRLAALALAGALAFARAAEACTSFLLKAAAGSPVYGRTMEFGFKLQSDAIVIPRQFAFTATGPGGKPGPGRRVTASWASMRSAPPSLLTA